MAEAPQYRAIITSKRQNPSLVDSLQRFRKRLFIDRLGWRLSIKEDRECDEFDTDKAVYAALLFKNGIAGCFRAICCDQAYLAESVFPTLATTRPFPRTADFWEISRFGVLPGAGPLERARLAYGLMLHFGYERNASGLVAVVDVAHERFLSAIGVRTRRYGLPQIIGTTTRGRPIEVVTGEIPLREQRGIRFRSLMRDAQSLEIEDETLVLRRSRVSA